MQSLFTLICKHCIIIDDRQQFFLQGLLPNDMDGADTLSTLHTLYSMTFTAIGECYEQASS